ncbi:MAG TPA: hypothetical protein VIL41_06115 [Coriobacteriia bacterium]
MIGVEKTQIEEPVGPIVILSMGVLLVGGGIAWAVITQRGRGQHHHLTT